MGFSCGSYKGIGAAQNVFAFEWLSEFFIKIKPTNILELGTGSGALTLMIHDAAKGYTNFLTADLTEWPSHTVLAEQGIRVLHVNINEDPAFMDRAKQLIQSPGTSVVLCDNGNKISEVNTFAPFLKAGDFILAHDYAYDQQTFDTKIKDTVWNWCEIMDSDIAEVCKKYNLIPYEEELFNQAAWTCRQKTAETF